jgi:hypothetical protein
VWILLSILILTGDAGGVDESERHAVVDIERANVMNKIAR